MYGPVLTQESLSKQVQSRAGIHDLTFTFLLGVMFNMGCKAACRGIKIICYQLGLRDSWTSVKLFIEL